MDVDEALEIADNPHHYTHLEQVTSRHTLAAAVRSMRREHELQEATLQAEVRRLRGQRDEAVSALDGENSELADHLRAQWES